MSASKEAYWDTYPCEVCGEAPSLLEHELCERCFEVVEVVVVP